MCYLKSRVNGKAATRATDICRDCRKHINKRDVKREFTVCQECETIESSLHSSLSR